MIRYTIVRVIWIFVVLSIILSLNFILLKLAPEYPPTVQEERDIYYARQVIDGYMTERIESDPAQYTFIKQNLQRLRDECPKCYYKDEVVQFRIYEPIPVVIQYLRWLRNVIVDWNWGLSTRISVNVSAFSVLVLRMPVTIRLNLLALFFYIPIGFVLGIIAALKNNSVTDNVISLGVMIFISIPSFVVMTILVMVFGYQLGWLPAQFPAQDVGDLSTQLRGLILPVLGLSFGTIAGLTRLTRAELSEVLTSEFVLLARTKGLTRQQAVVRHAMRNSMVPLVPSVIGSFVGLLSGSVIIERIYSIPGTGRIFLRALTPGAFDYNVILVTTAFYTVIGLFAVLLVDLSYGIVDPRIRMGGKK